MRTTRKSRPPDALQLLSALAASREERFAASALGGLEAPNIASLISGGLIKRDGLVRAVICDACDAFHNADLYFDADRQTYGWSCPSAGFVGAAEDEVAAVSFRMDDLAEKLRAAFDACFGRGRGRFRQLSGTEAWILGEYRLTDRSVVVALARYTSTNEESAAIENALAALPRADAGVVFTIEDAPIPKLPPRFRAITFSSTMAINEHGALEVDARPIRSIVNEVIFEGGPGRGGRPSCEAQVWHVLDSLDPDSIRPGAGLAGLVKLHWHRFFPNEKVPVSSTLRTHVRSWREKQQPTKVFGPGGE